MPRFLPLPPLAVALFLAALCATPLAGLWVGAAASSILAATLGVLALVLATTSFLLGRRLLQRERQARALRFLADRLQSMARVLPGGYCLFSPQGLLREEQGVGVRLGLAEKKIAHFDDLVAAVREGPELVALFRQLQQAGTEGSVTVTAAANGQAFRVSARRFRIGPEGPQVDLLWFTPPGEGSLPSSASASENAVRPTPEAATDSPGLFEALPFPVWIRAGDLRLVACNTPYAAAVDAPVVEVLREQRELMSHTAKGGSGRALAANALSRSAAQTERRHVVVAGKRRLLEITEVPLRRSGDDAPLSAAPGLPALAGFAVDVTAEEEKEAELQRHLGAHHEVMEHLGSAIAIYGPDMRLEFYNRAYLRLWEADEAFLNSKPTFGDVLEDLRARRRAPEQADFQRYKKDRLALFTSLLEPREDLMHLPDGTSLRILAAPHPFGGLMFVHEDVTDRLALESSYNTLIAVQRETLDHLAEGIAVFGPDGKLRLSNPAFARLWKLESAFLDEAPHVGDMLERMKPLFHFSENWADFKARSIAYALDRHPRTGRIERADKSVLDFVTVPLPDGSVLNSYRDMSDSVRVEQALRASNAALATADRLKSEFVANVSYQLRTPLNTITGFAEILTEQYFGTLNERQMEYTRTIREASANLSRLIDDVLDLATLEAGRMVLDRRPVQAADLLALTRQMAGEWARQQALEIVVDCPPDVGALEVDEHRMKQVMFDLISNAIQYTPTGGRITLEARGEPDQVILTVADTGVGIPENDQARVFGKFERSNTGARQAGAGLGLSLAKSFVELHGGQIAIASEVGKGTRVTCALPRKAPTEVGK